MAAIFNCCLVEKNNLFAETLIKIINLKRSIYENNNTSQLNTLYKALENFMYLH